MKLWGDLYISWFVFVDQYNLNLESIYMYKSRAEFTCLTYGSVNLQDHFLRTTGNLRTVHLFTLDFNFLHIRNFTDGPSVHLQH